MPTKRVENRRAPPPLIAIRYFEAAARRLSFAEAARELFVTPAAVSHQVKRLEDYLAIPLFERHNRKVVLTEKGAALAASLHVVFSDMHEALARVTTPREPKLRVSALPSMAAKWLVPRLHRFEAANPSVRIRIETSDHLVNFSFEPVDIALRYGAGNYRGHHVERLMSAEAFPVCSPRLLTKGNQPLKRPADLRRFTLLHDESSVRDKGVPNWGMWLKAAGAGLVDSRRGPVFGSIHLAIEAALSGHGVALGIAPLVEQDLRSGRLVCPFDLRLKNAFSFWIVCQRKRASDPVIRKFRSWLHAEAGVAV